MLDIDNIRGILDRFVTWAAARHDVLGVALVGSYARGAARVDSDIDLVVLTNDPQWYVEDRGWTALFGAAGRSRTEDYGRLVSVRVCYEDGFEVEYGFTTPAWAATPLEAGTARVISDGIIVLYAREEGLFPAVFAR